MENKTLGEKIRNFRKRAGMSQFDLEVQIGASPGSLSRIENGEVNPTKETINKIVKELNLDDFEILDLYSIKLKTIIKLLELMVELTSETDASKILQIAVNTIADVMGYRNVNVCLVEKECMYLKVMNNNIDTTNAIALAGKEYSKLKTKYHVYEKNNLLIKSATTGLICESQNLLDFSQGGIQDDVAIKIQKMTGMKNFISLPLNINKKIFGALFVGKTSSEPFEDEIIILELLSRHLGIAIRNSLIFNKLIS